MDSSFKGPVLAVSVGQGQGPELLQLVQQARTGSECGAEAGTRVGVRAISGVVAMAGSECGTEAEAEAEALKDWPLQWMNGCGKDRSSGTLYGVVLLVC